MPISQQGALNATALIVPDLYVQIVPPQTLVINGVPTNVVGVVGTASWGPVNQPTILATMGDYARNFGPVMARTFDMGTQVATAVQQGASSFFAVRVTDGTDTAASYAINAASGAQSATITALYTGSNGNNLSFTLSTGSKAGSWKATITLNGTTLLGEVFDNILGTGAVFWANLVSAINNGTGATRGPSRLVLATIGSGAPLAAAPAALTVQPGTGLAFAGGTDGAATITASTLIGQDISGARTGMYALRGKGCSIGVLADTFDSTSWTTQAAFGLSEGVYMILTGPKGDTLTNAVTAKQTAGLDTYSCKLMFGDWLFWNDTTNGLPTRLVSPQGFVAGRLANLSPEQSSLNKPLYSIIGSQRLGVAGSAQANAYSAAELSALFQAGIDVITNPGAGGLNIWTVRCGHNASSNAAINGDNYTRMTNYIAATLAAGMGVFVGEMINAGLFQQIRATQLSFLQNLLGQGILGLDPQTGAVPFTVICDASNNPASRTQLGYVQSDAQVRYQAINEKFIANLEGGQTVSVSKTLTPTN